VTVTETLTGLIPNSEVRLFRQSDGFELAGIENSASTFAYTYTYSANIPARFVIILPGYELIDFPVTLTATSSSIPIQQRIDYSYA